MNKDLYELGDEKSIIRNRILVFSLLCLILK